MVKFYRGLYSSYNYDKNTKTGKHLDCIYFATDVGKILMNGIEFVPTIDTSKFDSAIKGVTISNNVLTFTPISGSSFTVTIPTATSTTNGVMSSADKSKLDGIESDATKVEKSSTNGNIKINGTETTVYTHPSGTNPHGTTKSDVGLGNVGNFKAVSTVASQGLTDTEKANARANIGAGTSSFSGSYNDLSNKPNIPTVGNGTITITLNGATKGTFTTNLSGNTTIALTDNNTWRGIQDNLTSSSSIDSLSANQGRILNLTKVGFAKVNAAEIAKTNNNPFFGNVENEDIGIRNGNYYSVINLGSYSGGNFRSQIAMPYQDSIADSDIYIRTDRNGTWREWRKLIHSGNIGSQNVNYANSAGSAGSVAWENISGKPSSFTPASHTHDYLPLSGGTLTGATTVLTGGMWILGGSEAGGNNTRMSLDGGLPNGLSYNASKRGTRIYSNAIALADPINGNTNTDAGWIRHIEETENCGVLEIATGDDGNEGIVVRQYNTNSTIIREILLLNGSGTTSFPGTITSTGFKKSGSSDSYVLLGGGGHKGINDHSHTGAQVTMSGYSALSGGYVNTSDTVNSAINKIEDLLLWYEGN